MDPEMERAIIDAVQTAAAEAAAGDGLTQSLIENGLSALVAVVLFVPVVWGLMKVITKHMTNLATRDDISTIMDASLQPMSKNMERIADGLEKHNGDMTHAIAKLNQLPPQLGLAVTQAVNSQNYAEALRKWQKDIDELQLKIDMCSDDEMRGALQEKLDRRLANPPTPMQ